MIKRAKKRIGRPPGRRAPHRPVVSARVPEALYAMIKEIALAAGRTLGEEVIGRVQRSFEWEKAFSDARAIIVQANATAQQVTAQTLQAEMLKAGYTRVRGINGAAWFEPGVNSIQWIADSLPSALLEEMVVRATARAVERIALKGEQP